MEIPEEQKKKLREFLDEYPLSMIKTTTTIRDGYVSCIKPVKTICGPEVHCNSETRRELSRLGFI